VPTGRGSKTPTGRLPPRSPLKWALAAAYWLGRAAHAGRLGDGLVQLNANIPDPTDNGGGEFPGTGTGGRRSGAVYEQGGGQHRRWRRTDHVRAAPWAAAIPHYMRRWGIVAMDFLHRRPAQWHGIGPYGDRARRPPRPGPGRRGAPVQSWVAQQARNQLMDLEDAGT
jgi:hypothetical protein